MKKILFSLIAFIIICTMLFLFGEFSIRAFYPRFSNYNMEMWRYAAEIKQPLDNKRLPFHHYPNKEGVYYNAKIKTNSMGFRDFEYTLKKPEDKKRIVFIGDSFTLGWGVEFEDIYSKKLEKSLNENQNSYEVINMGVGNYNSIMETELFKSKGLSLNPDLVILMYFINDAEPTPHNVTPLEYKTRRNSYFMAFLLDRFIKFKTALDQSYDWKKYYGDLYIHNPDNLASNKKSLEELITLCNANNIKLLIVNIPELHNLKNYPFRFATQYISQISEEGKVPFLDLLPYLADQEPESLWVSLEDPHANAKANSIISNTIYEKIRNEGLLN
ncbi:MAG: GDSL-type esterase/lipase family protein [Thermodesulfovibrionia bacterium]|nr:GDSL-type esterase/lipase family protein [Thermodesulfovibrionia bacterium]